MTNSKYKPGALRIIVDKNGKQLLATPDGIKLDRQTMTVVSQDVEQAMSGICYVECEILVDKPAVPHLNGSIWIENESEFGYGNEVYKVESISEIEGITSDSVVLALIKCYAYPDTTV